MPALSRRAPGLSLLTRDAFRATAETIRAGMPGRLFPALLDLASPSLEVHHGKYRQTARTAKRERR